MLAVLCLNCCCCFGFIVVSFKKNISARIQNGTVMGNAFKVHFPFSLSLLIKIILKENKMDIYFVRENINFSFRGLYRMFSN